MGLQLQMCWGSRPHLCGLGKCTHYGGYAFFDVTFQPARILGGAFASTDNAIHSVLSLTAAISITGYYFRCSFKTPYFFVRSFMCGILCVLFCITDSAAAPDYHATSEGPMTLPLGYLVILLIQAMAGVGPAQQGSCC